MIFFIFLVGSTTLVRKLLLFYDADYPIIENYYVTKAVMSLLLVLSGLCIKFINSKEKIKGA